MNIFVLDRDPNLAAMYHCDKHVVKMILESAQMLSTAHWVLAPGDAEIYGDFYKKTHENHPCNLWVREASRNYDWLYDLFCALCDEYKLRYGKVHKTDKLLREKLRIKPFNIRPAPLTPFAICVAEPYNTKDPVVAYRDYYYYEKRHIAEWKYTETPYWFIARSKANG